MDYNAATKERILSGTALEWLGAERERFETAASRAHSQFLGVGV